MYFIRAVLILIIFILFSNRISVSFTLYERNLIVDYFKWKFIKQIIVFTCDVKYEHIELTKLLINNNIRCVMIDFNLFQSNITITELLNTEHDHFGIVLNGDCTGESDTILKSSGDSQKFGDKYQWLIFSKRKNEILRILSSVPLNVNTEITIALHSVSYWKLFDVYNPGFNHGGSLKINKMGHWYPDTGFQINSDMFVHKYWRRKNMTGITFKGTIVLVFKFEGDLMNYLHNNKRNKTVDNYSRFNFLLWDHVKDFYNFRLETYSSPIWGAWHKNGSETIHTGMIGQLQRREIDLAFTPGFYKAERLPVIDYITPTFILRACFIFSHPKPALSIRGVFFSPLDSLVWILTWIMMLLILLIVRLSFKQEWNIEHRFKSDRMEYDWSYIVLIIFGGLCQQDVPKIPNLYSGRTVIFTLILFTYLLYQFYSGAIVSSLLMEPATTIHDLKNLLDSSLRIGIEDIVYERDFFIQTSDKLALKLYETRVLGKKNGTDAFYAPTIGVQLVKKGGFAFQADTDTAYELIAQTYSNDLICRLGEVQLFPVQTMVVMCQQGSPFRELFTFGFQRLIEPGLVVRQLSHWKTRKPECIKVQDSSKINVGMDEFFPALLFYAIGILTSVIILTIEIIINRKVSRNCFKQLQTRKKRIVFRN